MEALWKIEEVRKKTNKKSLTNKELSDCLWKQITKCRDWISTFKENGKYWLIDMDKNILIEAKYDYLEYIDDDIIIVTLWKYKWVIDLNECILLPIAHNEVHYKRDWNFLLNQEWKFGVISKEYKVLLPMIYNKWFVYVPNQWIRMIKNWVQWDLIAFNK